MIAIVGICLFVIGVLLFVLVVERSRLSIEILTLTKELVKVVTELEYVEKDLDDFALEVLRDSQPVEKDKVIVVRESWYNQIRQTAQSSRPLFKYQPKSSPTTEPDPS